MRIRIKALPDYIRWQNRDVRDRYIRGAFRIGLVLEGVGYETGNQHFVLNRGPLEAALRQVASEAEMLVITGAWERDGLKPRDNVLLPLACADIVPDEPTEKEA